MFSAAARSLGHRDEVRLRSYLAHERPGVSELREPEGEFTP